MCVRQVCLLSMCFLYNIAAEVLANLINADKRFKGMQIGDHEIKIVHFTDNITTSLRDITWGTLKKYVHSRFPSFEAPLPLFAFESPSTPQYTLHLSFYTCEILRKEINNEN